MIKKTRFDMVYGIIFFIKHGSNDIFDCFSYIGICVFRYFMFSYLIHLLYIYNHFFCPKNTQTQVDFFILVVFVNLVLEYVSTLDFEWNMISHLRLLQVFQTVAFVHILPIWSSPNFMTSHFALQRRFRQ